MGVLDRITVSEAVGLGSIPGKDTFTALEPDGTAIGCDPIEVGSTAIGGSVCQTVGSDYVNFGD